MNTVIFSKNRAMQVDALLQSLEKNAPALLPATVLYTATSPEFDRGYTLVRGFHKQVQWRRETAFREDFLDCLRAGSEYTVLFPDDVIVFANVPQFLNRMEPDVLCFSLRLGWNTTYCYPSNQGQALSGVQADGPFLKWIYGEQQGEYAYPFSTDGHVFRTTELQSILADRAFSNPNQLEEAMQGAVSARRYMASFERSKLVSIPHNVVTATHRNRQGGGSAAELNDLLLRFRASRIDVEAMDFSSIIGPHQEVPYRFRRHYVWRNWRQVFQSKLPVTP